MFAGLQYSRTVSGDDTVRLFLDPESSNMAFNECFVMEDLTQESLDLAISEFKAANRVPKFRFFGDPSQKSKDLLAGMQICQQESITVYSKNQADWSYLKTQAEEIGPDHAREYYSVEQVGFGLSEPTEEGMQNLSDRLARQEQRAFGLREEGAFVSVATLVGNANDKFITNAVTLPEHRGKGYAKAVVAEVLNSHFSKDGSSVWVATVHPAMTKICVALGFLELGNIISYF